LCKGFPLGVFSPNNHA